MSIEKTSKIIIKGYSAGLTAEETQLFNSVGGDDIVKTVLQSAVNEDIIYNGKVFDYLAEAAETNNLKTSNILSELGYDGVHDGIEWVAFNSNQVKSATDNIGTFDKRNSDIQFSLATEQEELIDLYENGKISREEYLEKSRGE